MYITFKIYSAFYLFNERLELSDFAAHLEERDTQDFTIAIGRSFKIQTEAMLLTI